MLHTQGCHPTSSLRNSRNAESHARTDFEFGSLARSAKQQVSFTGQYISNVDQVLNIPERPGLSREQWVPAIVLWTVRGVPGCSEPAENAC